MKDAVATLPPPDGGEPVTRPRKTMLSIYVDPRLKRRIESFRRRTEAATGLEVPTSAALVRLVTLALDAEGIPADPPDVDDEG